jgi:KaiC/GvpD/RAD55 family RecA-like ATPase
MKREEAHDTAGVSDTTPGWIRTGRDFVCNASDPPPDLIEGFLPGGGLVMLTGAPGTAKTFLAMEAMRAVVHGDKAFGLLQAQPGQVMLLEQEHHEGFLASRLERAELSREDVFVAHKPDFRLDRGANDTRSKELGQFLKEQKIKLAVLDPFANFHARDEDKAHEVGPIIAALERLREASPETTFLIIHHTIKSGWDSRPSMKNARGTGRFAGSFDGAYELTSRSRRATSLEMTLTAHKLKDGAQPGELKLTLLFTDDRLVWSAEQKETGDASEMPEHEQREKMIRLLQEQKVFRSKGALYKAVAGNRESAIRILRALEEENLVEIVPVGRREEVHWCGNKGATPESGK